MYCPSCGQLSDDSAKFCKKCGEKLPNIDNGINPQPIHSNTGNQYNAINESTSIHISKSDRNAISNDNIGISDPRKKLGLILVVLGIFIALGGGFSASKLSNSYKPLDIYYGYDDNGSTTIYDSGKIGGNSEAVSYYNSMKYLFIIGGIAFICLGGWLYSSGSKYEKIPSITKKGKVIGLDANTVSIEFDDGTRERLQYLASKVVLVIGDKGNFEIKGKLIQSFKKEY